MKGLSGILLTGPLKTNFSDILMEIHTFSSKKTPEIALCKMAAILSLPQCVNQGASLGFLIIHELKTCTW